MDTTMPEIVESGPEIRPRQPESEPGSEPADRNVRPRLAPDQEVTQLDEVENCESTTQTRGDVCQTPDEVRMDNPPGAASSIPISYPLVSASNYLTVLPVETEFDSKAQAVVHGNAVVGFKHDWVAAFWEQFFLVCFGFWSLLCCFSSVVFVCYLFCLAFGGAVCSQRLVAVDLVLLRRVWSYVSAETREFDLTAWPTREVSGERLRPHSCCDRTLIPRTENKAVLKSSNKCQVSEFLISGPQDKAAC